MSDGSSIVNASGAPQKPQLNTVNTARAVYGLTNGLSQALTTPIAKSKYDYGRSAVGHAAEAIYDLFHSDPHSWTIGSGSLAGKNVNETVSGTGAPTSPAHNVDHVEARVQAPEPKGEER